MAKKGKSSEERTGAHPGPAAKSQLVVTGEPDPETGAELSPPIWGFGICKGAGGFLAYRLSSHGEIQVLNPLRHGEIAGEKKHTALARMMDAAKQEFLGPEKRRG